MMNNSELREDLVSLDEITLNVLSCGTPGNPVMLFLHGFPEYSGMWAEVMPQFADRYHCIAPDQRGYNLSYRPRGVDHYKTSKIVGDAVRLIDLIQPDQPVTLVAPGAVSTLPTHRRSTRPNRGRPV